MWLGAKLHMWIKINPTLTGATKDKGIHQDFALFQEVESHKETCLKQAAKRIKTWQCGDCWRSNTDECKPQIFFESIFRKGRKLMMTEQLVTEVIRNKKFSIRRLKLYQTQEKWSYHEPWQIKYKNITNRAQKKGLKSNCQRELTK